MAPALCLDKLQLVPFFKHRNCCFPVVHFVGANEVEKPNRDTSFI
jgi:hypothetical protein